MVIGLIPERLMIALFGSGIQMIIQNKFFYSFKLYFIPVLFIILETLFGRNIWIK